MSFDTDGFCSPTIERFRTSVRELPAYKPWFDFARDLNGLGLEMLRDRDVSRDDNQVLTIAILFVRAHKSFQAAFLLAERGLIADARAVLRSAAEGAIALNAVANDAEFLNQLKEAYHHNLRKMVRLMSSDADYQTLYPSKHLAQMTATVYEINTIEEKERKKFSDINWCDTATKYNCKDLYEIVYRPLSFDGTHTTIDAIDRQVAYDRDGRIQDLKVGPDTADLVETLKYACLTFLWAADPFARAFHLEETRSRIQTEIQRFDTLPPDEPNGVTVVPNFATESDCRLSMGR